MAVFYLEVLFESWTFLRRNSSFHQNKRFAAASWFNKWTKTDFWTFGHGFRSLVFGQEWRRPTKTSPTEPEPARLVGTVRGSGSVLLEGNQTITFAPWGISVKAIFDSCQNNTNSFYANEKWVKENTFLFHISKSCFVYTPKQCA